MFVEDGWDYSDYFDVEMLDVIFYNVFFNFLVWGGVVVNLVYCWWLNGLDVNSGIMDVYCLVLVFKEGL